MRVSFDIDTTTINCQTPPLQCDDLDGLFVRSFRRGKTPERKYPASVTSYNIRGNFPEGGMMAMNMWRTEWGEGRSTTSWRRGDMWPRIIGVKVDGTGEGRYIYSREKQNIIGLSNLAVACYVMMHASFVGPWEQWTVLLLMGVRATVAAVEEYNKLQTNVTNRNRDEILLQIVPGGRNNKTTASGSSASGQIAAAKVCVVPYTKYAHPCITRGLSVPSTLLAVRRSLETHRRERVGRKAGLSCRLSPKCSWNRSTYRDNPLKCFYYNSDVIDIMVL